MKEIPAEVNWVNVRAGCSLTAVFETLRLQIENDIRQRNEFLSDKQKQRFKFCMSKAGGVFTVLIDGIVFVDVSVRFSLTRNGIEVRDQKDRLLFDAVPTVSDDGQCRLMVDGKEKELWQVRKMALEELFFTEHQ